ncbi:hypothetical protein GQ43DRAFT_133029 [Delitschia confertaspora ATCC 74209]|uniref:Uncharacterized protein n=1 Tax=Delitschia confertaspora ATCC 74209 TaxID=1513339 RepID=A0A9P4JM97_9PLEO|nr:hypothetical protein GQ43DRAFT_133029 [Delitschia confertaspora ATCC 74209]
MSFSNICQATMNRFLTRKKDKVLDDGSSTSKKSKKSKKGQAEPKVEIDLAAALPSKDDFRTSLIMPSLSTRFSMLREQDDPSSKLGKASDDSVLYPKRQSRLHEFGFMKGGLSDIAEVSSIHSSIRPPFANERQGSFDSHSTEDGSSSVMSRARPGEGNVLFGGRQKVYKVSNTGASKTMGRILYDDDVSMSAFQRLRLQEKEERARELQDAENQENTEEVVPQSEPTSPTRDLVYSSSLSGYNQRRETSSSTNSGTANTRSSTAATSIASQGVNSIPAPSPALPSSATTASPPADLNRSATKARRLYDQGLDQHINDQQSSTLSRLNSIQRNIAPTGLSTPPLTYSQTRSATNLNDRFNRSGSVQTDSPTRMGSSTPLNAKEPYSSGSSPALSGPHSPALASPVFSDSEDAQTLNLALQPNDRGKATAMGAFNKPKMGFSEQQYAERLKRLHQEKEAPTPKVEKPQKPSLRERAESEARRRAESIASQRSREDVPVEREAASPFSVFQKAASQMKTSPSPQVSPREQRNQEQPPQDAPSHDSAGATFFAQDSSDEEEGSNGRIVKAADLEQRLKNIPVVSNPPSRPPPPILEHPALRSRSNSRPEHPPPSQALPPLPSSSGNSQPEQGDNEIPRPDIDSPTLGPNNSGLSGLVRQHLRTVSNVSSDYGDTKSSPPPVPAPLSVRTQELGSQRHQPASGMDSSAYSTYSRSNPWDLEDAHDRSNGGADRSRSISPVDTRKRQPYGTSDSPVSPISQFRDRSASQNDSPQWEKEVEKTHQRAPSTETQDEREAFQRELAQRQRAIQESLRRKISGENSRSASPAPSASASGLKSALTMLRAKSSRDSFATIDAQKHHEATPKALRMLGLGNSSANGSSTSLSGSTALYNGDHSKPEEDRIGQRNPLRSKSSRVLEQSEQDARRELGQRLQRSATDDSSRAPRSTMGRSPPESSRSSIRNRSDSELSNSRSQSRAGRYRDDLEKAMMEGTGSSASAYPPNSSPSIPGFVANPTQPISEASANHNQERLRSRSNSRTNGAGYFEPKAHLQIHTGQGMLNGNMARLSPAANSPQPSFSPGLPVSPRPSPGATSSTPNALRPPPSPVPPLSITSTPSISAATTPVIPSFSGNVSTLTKSGTRKKSIAKSDISEPLFISATSVMDTVDLPAGASLKNGMEPPPPVPPINPRRRFGFGRPDRNGAPTQTMFAEPTWTNSSDELNNHPPQGRQKLRKASSEGKSLHAAAHPPTGVSPALPSHGLPQNHSPPRLEQPEVAEGAMF